jgi:ABC-type lipopolysaccharide export system ATPase subunit
MEPVINSFNSLVESINFANKKGSYTLEQSANIYESLNITKDFIVQITKIQNNNKQTMKKKLETILEEEIMD